MFIRLVPTLERVRRWKRWGRWTSVISIGAIALWTIAIWIRLGWTTGPVGALGQQFSVSLARGTLSFGAHRRTPTVGMIQGRFDLRDTNHVWIAREPSVAWSLPSTHRFVGGGYLTRTLAVPLWPVAALAVGCVILSAQVARRMERAMPMHPCHRCGYSLDGVALDRCPECGTKAHAKPAGLRGPAA